MNRAVALRRLRRSVSWWTNRKFTSGAAAIISNAAGEILFVRERFRDRKEWGLPGGYLGRGEAPADAMRRELREELHVEAATVEFVAFSQQLEIDHIDMIFAVTLAPGQMPVPGWELQECRWFPRSALPPNLTAITRRLLSVADGEEDGTR